MRRFTMAALIVLALVFCAGACAQAEEFREIGLRLWESKYSVFEKHQKAGQTCVLKWKGFFDCAGNLANIKNGKTWGAFVDNGHGGEGLYVFGVEVRRDTMANYRKEFMRLYNKAVEKYGDPDKNLSEPHNILEIDEELFSAGVMGGMARGDFKWERAPVEISLSIENGEVASGRVRGLICEVYISLDFADANMKVEYW